jgi:perosamine synthetase
MSRMQLAIAGGKPVRETFLPYGRQSVDEADIQAVVDVLRSDWLTTGPKVEEFEEVFAAAVGARCAVAVSSGTAALHAAAFAAGLGPGHEAVTTPMTFAATSNVVLYQGARPVFVDVQPDTLNIDPDKVKAAITPRTRAILPVDFTGLPADMEEITALAQANGLVVIEDAAHALGATYHGRPVGTLADLTVFSTHPVKHITSAEGGVVTLNDPQLAARLRTFRNHGISTGPRDRHQKVSWLYEMVLLGYNYRLTDVQCALGISQIRKLPGWLDRRRAIAAQYTSAIDEMPELEAPKVAVDREPAWHLYTIRLRLERLRVGRAEIFKALRAENIGVNVLYIPVPWHPYYQGLGYVRGAWPVAEAAYERLLSLPMFPAMSDTDVDSVLEAVDKVISHYRL